MATWHPPGSTLPIIIRYGDLTIYSTERLCSHFCWGLGDIALSDLRIGSTPLDQYTGWDHLMSRVPDGQRDRTVLTGYSSALWPGDAVPTSVQTLEGGKLEQRAGLEGAGWIDRTATEACTYVQVDIAGRLFRQGSGIEALTCELEAQYQRPGDPAGLWQNLPWAPITLRNGSTTLCRWTFAAVLPQPALRVRVRRKTPDPVQAAEVSELECVRIKFFRTDAAKYPAQTRSALLIKATGQLNGRLDRLSAVVTAKCWTWPVDTPYDGSLPGSSAWVWAATTNPAFWFIFYARGGFLDATHPRGWCDGPRTSAGQRLFGAGLPDSRIDYPALVTWARRCRDANLSLRMVISEQRPAGSVLDDIAAAGRASKTWAPGKLSVWWEAPGQPHLAVFGMANIIAGTFSVSYADASDVDEFALEYTRSDDDYGADTVYATVPGVAQPVQQRSQRAAWSMPRADAQRTVNLLAASSHYHRRTVSFEAALEGLMVARGDVIVMAHDLTRWGSSGRLVALTLTGGRVATLRLSRAVPTQAGQIHLWLRRPDGTLRTLTAVASGAPAESDLFAVDGWPADDAPAWLDASGASNPASAWPDSAPEDWMFLGSPSATPGKRLRVMQIQPSNHRRVKIICRDEEEGYYGLEWGGTVSPPWAPTAPAARAHSLSLVRQTRSSGWLLQWQLEHASGATVSLSVNGGATQQVPVRGVMTTAGTQLDLPDYASGTLLQLSVLPVPVLPGSSLQGDSLTVTVSGDPA